MIEEVSIVLMMVMEMVMAGEGRGFERETNDYEDPIDSYTNIAARYG